jgi:cell division septum initiation protein DivIVA
MRPEDLTVSGLPRSPLPGGIKVAAVADLLRRAAWDYGAAIRHARELNEAVGEKARRIEELEAQVASLEADIVAREAGTETIGKALLAVARVAEEIAAEAHASAERMTTDAEARATTILEQATAKAEERNRESLALKERLEIELAAARAAFEKQQAASKAELEQEREQLNRDREAMRELLERERTRVEGEAYERAEALLDETRRRSEQLRALLTDSRRRLMALTESALSQLEDFDAKGDCGQEDLLDDLRPPDGGAPRSAVAED